MTRLGRWIRPLIVVGLATGCSVGTGLPERTDATTSAGAAEPSTATRPATTAPATTASSTTLPPTTQPPTTQPPTTVDPLVAVAAGMSVEALVGQVLMVQMSGTGIDDASTRNTQRYGVATPAEIVADLRPGGIVFLGENTPDVASVSAFTDGLQAAAAEAGLPGLTISVDQEGGRVNRLRDIELFPSARRQHDEGLVEAYATSTAASLSAAGINVVLGPVADTTDASVGVIGDRAYDGDPDAAAASVATVVVGFERAGVAAVVKHWPGHGRTTIDSHISLPTIEGDRATWEAQDRPPFVAAVTAGVDAVMLGHLAVPALDPTGTPATVSAPIVAELRDGLGFDGIVMTDSLQMGAMAGDDPLDVAIGALGAGVDVLLDPAEPVALRDGLVGAIESGALDRVTVEAAVVRILRWKQSLGLEPARS